jgi:hypothetical protein
VSLDLDIAYRTKPTNLGNNLFAKELSLRIDKKDEDSGSKRRGGAGVEVRVGTRTGESVGLSAKGLSAKGLSVTNVVTDTCKLGA